MGKLFFRAVQFCKLPVGCFLVDHTEQAAVKYILWLTLACLLLLVAVVSFLVFYL